LGVVGLVVRTFRWRALLVGLGLAPSFGRLLKLYFVGAFFNTFLLSGFGGDVVRVIELAQDERRSAAFGTVLVDRMTGILSLFLMGLIVLPFTRELALVCGVRAISVAGWPAVFCCWKETSASSDERLPGRSRGGGSPLPTLCSRDAPLARGGMAVAALDAFQSHQRGHNGCAAGVVLKA
jgi:hypothetical protein